MILFMVLTMLFTACGKLNRDYELALCGSYAVPWMAIHDLKGGTFSSEVLEEDAYGRILYTYTAKNQITGEKETAVVICQKIDTEYVYYYEDRCFLLGNYTPAEMDSFKAENHWGKPLVEKNLSRRANKISYDLYIMTDNNLTFLRVKGACRDQLQLTQEQVKSMFFIDMDSAGHELYLLPTDDKFYIIMVNSMYQVVSMSFTAENFEPSEVAAFKQNNGWRYGY